MSALWFSPICDEVAHKIITWHNVYEAGDVFADRKWVNLDGAVVDRPTKYAHKIAFRPAELQHLVRILEALAPKSHLTTDFRNIMHGLKRGRLLPGGRYQVTCAFYKEDLKDVYDILARAKHGQVETVEEIAKRQKDTGKDLFEI